MSFRCGLCGEQQPDGVAPILTILEQRAKRYPQQFDGEGKLTDRGGTGMETVKELPLCTNCVALRESVDE